MIGTVPVDWKICNKLREKETGLRWICDKTIAASDEW